MKVVILYFDGVAQTSKMLRFIIASQELINYILAHITHFILAEASEEVEHIPEQANIEFKSRWNRQEFLELLLQRRSIFGCKDG